MNWKVGKLLGIFVVLSAAGAILAMAGSALWETEDDVLFGLADAAASYLPGNIDVPVAIFTGIVAGLVFLFTLDTTKRAQLVLTLGVGAPMVVVLVSSDNVVLTATNEPTYFLFSAGLTAGIVLIGTSKRTLGDRPLNIDKSRSYPWVRYLYRLLGRLRVPWAGAFLYIITVMLIVVVVIQYPLVRPDGPPVWLTTIAGVVAVPCLATLVHYQRITVVAMKVEQDGAGSLELKIGGGMYQAAKEEYLAEGGGDNNPWEDVSEHLRNGNLGEVDTGTLSDEQFEYLPEGLSERPTTLRISDGYSFSKSGIVRFLSSPWENLKRIIIAPIKEVQSPVDVDDADHVLVVVGYPEHQTKRARDACETIDEARESNTEATLIVYAEGDNSKKEFQDRMLQNEYERERQITFLRSEDESTEKIYVPPDSIYVVTDENVNHDTEKFKRILRRISS